jgi:hypothetical protein
MRSTDNELQAQLEEMIRHEQDAVERARLMVMYQMVAILIDNVGVARETSDKFSVHAEMEAKLLNRAWGVWKTMGAAVLVVQLTLGYVLSEHLSDMKAVQTTVYMHSKELDTIKERHRIEDRIGAQR